MQVIKRDGTEKPFNNELIFNAVKQAALRSNLSQEESSNLAATIASKLTKKFEKDERTSVEDIQDSVEKSLMQSAYKDVARSYIEYRHDRDNARIGKSKLFEDIDNFLNGEDESLTKENSNKSAEQLVSHRDLVTGIVSKHLAKNHIPKDIIELHNKGAIHIHDLDYFISKGISNCGVYDFEYMLANGVKLGDVEIESPKSIGTAANVTCQIFSKISGSSYGGQSLHEFDNVMKPYALLSLEKLKSEQRKYGLPEKYIYEKLRKEIYDACQTFIYQIQTVTSNNGQSSFAAISLSLSTDPICKMIKEEYLKCHMNGIGKDHKTPIFPKVLYFVEDGINLNKEDPNYNEFKLAMECSTKQMYPDYIMAPNNRKMTGDSENVITSMGK